MENRIKQMAQENLKDSKLMEKGIPLRFAKDIIKLYPDNFKDLKKKTKESLFIHGKTGTGKTLFAIASALYAVDCKISGLRFINVSELLYQIRLTYSSKYQSDFIPSSAYGTEEDYIMKTHQNTPILILDDLGAEKTTDWALQTLYLIINYRYENMMETYVTSNFAPNELNKRMEDSRFVSRICSMGRVVELSKFKRK